MKNGCFIISIMKKSGILFLTLILSACSKNDYYKLSFEDINIVVGFDTLSNISNNFEIINKDSISLNLDSKHFANVSFENGYITCLQLFLKDYDTQYKINDIVLDKSISKNCELLNGQLVHKKTNACIIQKQVKDKLNVVILNGDLLNTDIDELSQIEIYIK